MYEMIEKRNGQKVPFNTKKITDAICKAGKTTGEFDETIARQLTLKVINLLKYFVQGQIPKVEEIQDVVEEILLSSPYKKTAKAFIIYRDQHMKIREISERTSVDLVDAYLEKLDWQVKENSNMSYSLQGLNNYLSSEVSKIYWLNKIYPNDIKKAHLDGDFHIHDLSLLSVYCVGWDLQDLLTNGFRGVSGKIESTPPKHFRSALGQIVNFFYTLQGEAAGAQAFSNFDTLLAPFIKYDNLSYKEVKQALQEFLFNVNIPTRVGFQTPFTNITMDLTVPKNLKDQPVIIGGEYMDECYGDFSEEITILNKAFMELMCEGDASGRVFTFPIPTYNITEDFNWDDPNLEILWQAAAKYGIPYFSNFINSDMSPEDSRSMCCRLRLDTKELEKRGGGLFGSNPLTGSVGVVTINMPRIGYQSTSEQEFFDILEERMELAKKSLEIKRKILEKLTDANLYPYTSFYLRNIKKRHGVYWKNHFSTIGLVGMNEAAKNIFKLDITTAKGKDFAERVLSFMRDKLAVYQEETGNLYNLEATPAEGTSYRLAKLDKAKYPQMLFANNDSNAEHPYYTNSSHLPVDYSDNLFDILDHQDSIQTKYTGGTVQHLYLGEKNIDPDGIKKLVKQVCNSYHLPYFTISPIFSICPEHGYIQGEVYNCDICNKETEVYSRIVGYIRPLNQWNNGKQAEFEQRQNFVLEKSVQNC